MYATRKTLEEILRRIALLEAATFGQPGPATLPAAAPRAPRPVQAVPDGPTTPEVREQRIRRLVVAVESWPDYQTLSMREMVRGLRARGHQGSDNDLREVTRIVRARTGQVGIVVDPALAHLVTEGRPAAPHQERPAADMPAWLAALTPPAP